MTIMIEISVSICIILITAFCLYRQNRENLTKTSDFIYVALIFSLTFAQVLIQISSATRGKSHLLTQISLGVLFACAIVYLLIRQRGGSPETRETARVWITWTMFLVFAVSTCLLLGGFFNAKAEHLLGIPFTLAICLAMAYCPPAFDRLAVPEKEKAPPEEEDKPDQSGEESETTIDPQAEIIKTLETRLEAHKESIKTLETGLETHKESVISLAIESWSFAKAFERLLEQAEINQSKRYASQLRWFTKQTEDSLADVGLRIANVEGHPYEVGIPATPLNIGDFDVDDPLEVDVMIEPIILEGTVPINTGKITLRKIDS